MKRLLILSTWFLTAATTLLSATIFYLTTTHPQRQPARTPSLVARRDPMAVLAYAALPQATATVESSVVGADARPVTIDNYLADYHSPLYGLGPLIVETADRYGIDPYFFTAVAQQESNLCKLAPENSYNCWGWGIHTEGSLAFENYETAIQTVFSGLKTEYFDKGYTTPDEIMTKYTPLSNGSWAAGVEQFMEELSSGNF